jgi:hypothetical protein
MSKRTKALARELHDQGLRRKLAERAARALASSDGDDKPPKEVRELAERLRSLADRLHPRKDEEPEAPAPAPEAPEAAPSEPKLDEHEAGDAQPEPAPEPSAGEGDDVPESVPAHHPRERPPSAQRIRPRARRN